MASSSLPTWVHGLAARSTFDMQEELSCNKTIRLHTPWSIASSRLQAYSWHIQDWSHKKMLMSLNAISGEEQPSEDGENGDESSANDNLNIVNRDLFRKNLENIIGNDDDATFGGKELAMLIRSKYGRSYDVQLIKKEFMGRQLLAMNVMWKYREQRSFPLTEEEYLLHLDGVANNLKCWGAVSYVRNSLAKTKERPRIGKAVSIFIDLDESGGRANEWIYR